MRSGRRGPRLLLATDGDRAADRGIELVSALVDRAATVQTVAVVATDTPRVRVSGGSGVLLDERHRRAQVVAARAAEELRRAGFVTTSSSPEGRPGGAIARLASMTAADVVVLAASNHAGSGHRFGSVTRAVLGRSSCGVLVVHDVIAAAPTEVVLVAGEADPSDAAVDLLARLLDPRRCRVTVVGLVGDRSRDLVAAGRHVTARPTARAGRGPGPSSAAGVERIADRLRSHGLEVVGSVVAGESVACILEEITDRRAGLVVLGGHRRGTGEGTLLGPTSRAVLSHAPATLLIPD